MDPGDPWWQVLGKGRKDPRTAHREEAWEPLSGGTTSQLCPGRAQRSLFTLHPLPVPALALSLPWERRCQAVTG